MVVEQDNDEIQTLPGNYDPAAPGGPNAAQRQPSVEPVPGVHKETRDHREGSGHTEGAGHTDGGGRDSH